MSLPQLDIDRLTVEERIDLAERLWSSLRESPDRVPLTRAQEEELDRRVKAYRHDKDAGQPWREAIADIRREGG